MWISVVIATLNRRDVLHDTVLSLARQSRQADEIVLSVVDPAQDLNPETLKIPGVRVVVGPRGSTFQRNTGVLSVHPACDLISFLDDDVELHPDYLRNGCEFMAQHPEIVGISDGGMIANGASIGGLSRDEAIKLVESSAEVSTDEFRIRDGLYGCDMMVRRTVAEKTLFDTRMRHYALYEDTDFSARCARFGALAAVAGCQIVHLGTQTSRPSPRRYGYAHVMNGFYLWKKGSQSGLTFLSTTTKGLLANIIGLVVGRRGLSRAQRGGRLWGNVLGFRDIVLHGAQPERIEHI
ncbi:MAG: glycosyltransferase [Terracidiphilus sp.]|jgi:GT2 family glycosyltransferase